MVLKSIHDASQYLVVVLECGRCTEERIKGTAGRRKRGSWCGMQLRKAVPEMAESRGSWEEFHFGEKRNR